MMTSSEVPRLAGAPSAADTQAWGPWLESRRRAALTELGWTSEVFHPGATSPVVPARSPSDGGDGGSAAAPAPGPRAPGAASRRPQAPMSPCRRCGWRPRSPPPSLQRPHRQGLGGGGGAGDALQAGGPGRVHPRARALVEPGRGEAGRAGALQGRRHPGVRHPRARLPPHAGGQGGGGGAPPAHPGGQGPTWKPSWPEAQRRSGPANLVLSGRLDSKGVRARRIGKPAPGVPGRPGAGGVAPATGQARWALVAVRVRNLPGSRPGQPGRHGSPGRTAPR